MRPKKQLRAVLQSWRSVVKGISTLTEDEARWCLEEELNGECRKNTVERLYGRLSRLRHEREWYEIARRILERRPGG
jgi:hypothetical protein